MSDSSVDEVLSYKAVPVPKKHQYIYIAIWNISIKKLKNTFDYDASVSYAIDHPKLVRILKKHAGEPKKELNKEITKNGLSSLDKEDNKKV